MLLKLGVNKFTRQLKEIEEEEVGDLICKAMSFPFFPGKYIHILNTLGNYNVSPFFYVLIIGNSCV